MKIGGSEKSGKLTFNGGAKQNQAIVEVLSVSLERDFGVIGELEIEIEAARLERVEEDRVGGFEGEIVEKNEDATI